MRMRDILLLILCCTILASCEDDNQVVVNQDDPDLIAIDYAPNTYDLNLHDSLPFMDIPADNPMTVAGVDLGRHLFYDPIMSSDSTISCSSCHNLKKGFSDPSALSFGVNGATGTRNSMSLLNIGFAKNGLFWDGRARTLEEQAIEPIEAVFEMNETWENVEAKLRRSEFYPAMFRKAFGITKRSEITQDLVVKALAQFERTLVVYGGSKYDKVVLGLVPGLKLEDEEADGVLMYFDIPGDDFPDAECFHCHGDVLFGGDDYFNNGLTEAEDLDAFPDLGRGAFTGNILDNGRFKAPSLRNIALTAPYMHDGRFQTLEEVLDHYNSGGHPSPNKNELVLDLGLSDYQKSAIIAFLHTLTDTSYYDNPAFANPFEE